MTEATETLKPDSYGQVYISTAVIIRALISADFLGCEADFTYAPTVDGYPATGVRAGADGSLTWIVGNLGHLRVVHLGQGTYRALGWEIAVAADGGLRITNEASGKAFAIHPDRVESS
jgi:hypothetical protein